MARKRTLAVQLAELERSKRAARDKARKATRKRRRRSVRRSLARLVWRYRAQWAPLPSLPALWLAGLAAEQAPVGGAAGLGVVLAGAVGWRLRARLHLRRHRVAALLGCVLPGLWLPLCAALGVQTVDGPGVIVWTVGACWWWARHRTPAPTVIEAAPSGFATLWAAHVATPGGPLPGSTISTGVPFEHGVTFKVELVRGRQHLGTAQQGLPMVASGTDTPLDRLIVEQDPDDDRPAALQVRQVTTSPIREPILFDRPVWDGGNLLLGPHADGMGDAWWRLYSPDSMWGGFLLGSPGSGKSRMLESLAITALARGDTCIIYLDGQSGASSPLLWEHAALRAGPDDAAAVLAYLLRLRARRQAENVALRLTGFEPSPARPGVLTLVDECHGIFDTQADGWAKIAREGRKVGQALIGASQYSGLDSFGGKDVLRSSLIEGNAVAMRTSSRTSAQLMPGLGLDPATFPRLPGFGYLIAAPDSGMRTAPLRGRWLPSDRDLEKHQLGVPSVAAWFATYLKLPAPQISADTVPVPVQRAEPDDREARTTAAAILALDWDGYHGRMERAQIIAELPPATHVSTVTKALRGLVDAGHLGKAGHGTYQRSGQP